ncbi:NAD(P)H-hydrate dehydratase [Aerococcaceae bacterium DSM 111022]|nr:NAD(P)H-hydrate dehydratase [Aerococcaceae bacterium DSM 111022]
MEYITKEKVIDWLPIRHSKTYKNKLGHVLIIAGNENKGGAAIMSALSALQSGAGLVTVATSPNNQTALQTHAPEAMSINLNETDEITKNLATVNTIVIGPGLGLDKRAESMVQRVLTNSEPSQTVILDADALTLYSKKMNEWRGLSKAKLIMTPHAGEWERIMGVELNAVKEESELIYFANHHQATLIAKGAPTRVITSDTIYENTSGNPSQATGGMGDTLTGIIASLVGQFDEDDYNEAILSAVYIHSYTADILAETHYVTLPTLVSKHYPIVMRQLIDAKDD